MKTWWIYLVRCNDGSLYTGITVDVERRLVEHQGTGKRGAKYLRGRGPLILEFKKRIGEKGLALKVERRIKRLEKSRKEDLLNNRSIIQEIIARSEVG